MNSLKMINQLVNVLKEKAKEKSVSGLQNFVTNTFKTKYLFP